MKKYIPNIFIKIIKLIKGKIVYYNFKKELKEINTKNKDIKLVIGSGNTSYKGWLNTDLPWFNILDVESIKNFFPEKKISIILTEHVFEHLNTSDGIRAIKNLKSIIKKNGKIRLAVPDGYHSNQDYINLVKPGGTGDADHKELYNYNSIKKLFDEDFEIKFFEYFNENKQFVYNNWNNTIDEGFINRSRYNDPRNDKNNINYSSLIIDAILKK